MARLLNATRFKSPVTAVTTFTVTIPATTAGSKLICIAGGGAVITASIGGTNLTKRDFSIGNREVAAQDIVDAAGGTTTVGISLNGAENVDGMIYEFAAGSVGNYIAGANQGGTGGNTASGVDGRVKTGQITTTGPSVVFAMFTAGDSLANISNPQRAFWGFEPLGKVYANEGIYMASTYSKYWSMIGVSDQASALTLQAQSSRIVTASEQQSCIWAYQDLSGGVPTYTNPYQNAIEAENSLPGTLASQWFVAGNTYITANISGYTDSITYAPGSTVNFKVYSNNVGFNVEITRMGGYGHEAFGGRAQATIAGTPTVQAAPTVNAYGGEECSWATNATWAIPSTATPGVYSYICRRTDNAAYMSSGLFVVRSTPPVSKGTGIMIVTADFTWQAYNVWGGLTDSGSGYASYSGHSLYGKAPNVTQATRSYAVSFNRPLGTGGANTSTYYFDSEANTVQFLELNGYDVSYYSMVDIDITTSIPSKYRTVMVQGHNEYWTSNFYTALTAARDAGTNLMFLSSNTALWHARFDPADTARRNLICYKDSLNVTGYDNTTKFDPVSYTGTWRDPRTTAGNVNNTDRRPESGITGQWFIGNSTLQEFMVVSDTYKTLPMWRNTRVATSTGIVFRGANSASMTVAGNSCSVTLPANTQIGDLMVAAIVFNGNPSFDGAGFKIVSKQTYDAANMTLYLVQTYAKVAGATTLTFTFTNGFMASLAVSVYGGAVWEETNTCLTNDTSGGTVHATGAATPLSNNRWAITAFADATATNATTTTTWTAGAGMTSRAQTNNASAVTGTWTSLALMDSAGAVTQAAHSYSATAQFGNAHAAAALMYISPGTSLQAGSIGNEWDYVKKEEPSTPANMVLLTRQPLQITAQQSDYYGASYTRNGTLFHSMTLYKATSGALVFNSGSWHFTQGLGRYRDGALNVNTTIDTAMQQALINLLRDFGHTPTTLLSIYGNNDPTALVDPGTAQPASAYGLDAPAQPVYQSIFTASTFPTYTSTFDTTDYTLGTLFTTTDDGKIHGARWHYPDNLPTQPVVAGLFSWTNDTVGTLLASATFSNPQSGWNNVLFNSPISITANTKYVITVWTKDNYVYTPNQFTSGAVVNGNLVAPQDATGAHNGKYTIGGGSLAYPTTSFTASGYLADVLFESSGNLLFQGWGIPIN
ncbi:MAG TPA: DUF4082 domain-containing protein [Candidatus Saccharimonadales bacterium]